MADFIFRNIRWIGVGFLLCFFSGFGQTFFISLSNEHLRQSLSLSHAQFGGIYAIATLCSAFAMSQFGYVTDVWSVRKSALITLTGLVSACFLMAFADLSVILLFAAILGLRLFGQGFPGHVAFTAAGKWFSVNRGKAISLVGMGFPLSEVVFPLFGASLIALIGFTQMWGLAGALVLCLAMPGIYVLLRQDRHPVGSGEDAEEYDKSGISVVQWRRRDVVRRPEFYLVNIAVLCPPFMVTAFFFHQQHLAAIKDWPLSAIVGSMAFFAGFQIVAKLVTGVLIDKWSAKALLPFYLFPLAIGLSLPFLTNLIVFVPLVLGLLGMSAGISATLLGVLWPELFGSRYLGEIRSLTYAAMVASTAISPFLTGYLIDMGLGFDVQLMIFGGFCILASVVMFLIQPGLARLNGRLNNTVE